LQYLQNSGEPFFLAVGFYKPHLPFNAPIKYWDLYDPEEIHLPENYFFPEDAPDAARFNWGELRNYHGIPKKGPVPDSNALKLIHGYYACVSYVDAQIGKVLDALEGLGLADNTIIVLWGDHGWFLGEHGFWSKHCNFKRAAHSPLIIKVPWKDSGKKSEALVEFVDIYPTLCELSGLSLPYHLQGESFVPLLDDPEQPWKEAIFFRRSGETVITETHAYTEWINYETGEVWARMLYDHRIDPEENINVAELPENKKLVESLHNKLHEHMKSRDELIIP
jgi:arylsulfatase A-like enzyme